MIIPLTHFDNVIVCGSNKHSQLALFPSQMQELEQFSDQTKSYFDYIPIDVSKLMKSGSEEEIIQVCIGLTFTLYLSCRLISHLDNFVTNVFL